MTRITKVVDEWDGTCIWFLNGKYVGHDDQYEIDDVMKADEVVTVELEKIVVPAGWFETDLGIYSELDEIRGALGR